MSEKPVPEVILKRRERAKKDLEYKKKMLKKNRKDDRARRQKAFKRAKNYAVIQMNKEKNLAEQKKRALEKNCFYVEPAPKLLLVVRVRGLKHIRPKPKKVLSLLRLKNINNAVFLRVNKSTMGLLKLVDPFVTYGYPSLKTIKDLICKRGFLNINGQRAALTSNRLVEEKLGKYNIICAEDLINELHTVGENFKWANNALWPFHLRPPKNGYRSIKKHFVVGGSFGNREGYINDLVAKMI